MAFEPYLMNRKQVCFRAPASYSRYPRLPTYDPNCTTGKYTGYFRDRWKALSQNVCARQNQCNEKPLCPLVVPCGVEKKDVLAQLTDPRGSLTKAVSTFNDICIPELYDQGRTTNNKTYQYPWSHNNVDDCCKAECPCLDTFPEPPQIDYVCKGSFPCPPMEDCTTYKHFFPPKPTPCPPARYRPHPYDPCECPLESATSYRLDYEHKDPVPNGPVMAAAIKRGMWSMDQFCQDFKDDTEVKSQFIRKCQKVRQKIINPTTLECGTGRMDGSAETCSQFVRKCGDRPCYPEWIENDQWLPPESPLETCTTYKHFYKPHYMTPFPENKKIKSPDAIPFSSINNMWYTCCDPEVDQRIPVEMRDQDPWPIVRTCPIKYQNNLQVDPCASFRDETTYKADYFAKKRCAPNKWYGPSRGYTPPILPFNDTTVNRVSFPAYSPNQYKEAKTDSGNPNGILWGPYKCPPGRDKCRPSFPPPYGHPIKPYTKQCPCGQFDDRSMYHRDFKFWTPEMVDQVNDEHCRTITIPKGISLYRASYVEQGGKRAAVMPPPKSTGQRCMNPCNFRDLDPLYRISFRDFWKAIPRESLEKYRGKPTIKTRVRKGADCTPPPENITMFQMPPGTTVEDTLSYLAQQERK
ncbi:unnamed protein product [Orchesella dallaii]|uniref:Stabilizer of axonemal microtubules 1 n=1 Tax=Orchesella dallaii TaxID=48710 RepID=A0ABP1QKI9_9HEXA